MQCVIPCAGKSTRMNLVPKTLLLVKGKPVIQHIIDQWKDKVDNFIFVLRKDQVYLWEILPFNSAIVFQENPSGLADAIMQAAPYVGDRFIVALGDCLTCGEFQTYDGGISVGVYKDNLETSKNYLVEHDGGRVVKLIEKPSKPGLCGMGTYFFNRSIFSIIREHGGYVPGGGDLTEMLQRMVDMNIRVDCNQFKGVYVNINSPDDLMKAEELLNARSSRP